MREGTSWNSISEAWRRYVSPLQLVGVPAAATLPGDVAWYPPLHVLSTPSASLVGCVNGRHRYLE